MSLSSVEVGAARGIFTKCATLSSTLVHTALLRLDLGRVKIVLVHKWGKKCNKARDCT